MDGIYILTAYMGVPLNLFKIRGQGYANLCRCSSSLPIYTCNITHKRKLNFRSTDILHDAVN